MSSSDANDPVPASPEDVGLTADTPDELGQFEGAFLLANEARDQLREMGFDDVQIDAWAEKFIAERSSGTAEQFVVWIAERERLGDSRSGT